MIEEMDRPGSYFDNLSAIPKTSGTENIRLFYAGNYTELVRRNLRFVVSVAIQFPIAGSNLDDLIQEGNLGLIRACKTYDPEKSAFITYAVHWVRRYMQAYSVDHLRNVRLPECRHRMIKQIICACDDFLKTHERDPGHEEIAEVLGVTVEYIRDALEFSGYTARGSVGRTGFSLSEHQLRSRSYSHPDSVYRIEDVGCANPSEDTERHEEIKKVAELLATLNDRERLIISRMYGFDGSEDGTLAAIGKELGITKERVRQIKGNAMKRLQKQKHLVDGLL